MVGNGLRNIVVEACSSALDVGASKYGHSEEFHNLI
jgi:hypothetical protein